MTDERWHSLNDPIPCPLCRRLTHPDDLREAQITRVVAEVIGLDERAALPVWWVCPECL